MYAAIKGELLSGAGHVSLIGGIGFQLFFRQGTGSMLDGSSLSRVQVDQWLHLDPVFPLIAVACVAPGALIRRLRPIAVGLAVPLVAMLRPGYLPVPYVIAMLPFAGVLVAGVADAAAAWLPARWKTRAGLRWRPLLPPLVLAGIACAALATPIWVTQQRGLFQPPLDEPLAAAQTWVERNVPRDARLAVDDAIWVDLVRAGFPRQNVVWYYKIDTDPAVALEAPGGWRDYDYVVSTQSLRDALPAQPQLASALASSLPIATFGAGTSRVDIHRVIPQGLSAGSPNSTRRLGSRN
jgi:hypothetical protein